MKRSDFRSGLEFEVAKQLEDAGITYEYEETRVEYQKPVSKYLVDFELPNGILIETKGRFKPADRTKHLLIKQQHPGLDIRFVFSNSQNTLSKKSSTTYADWCDKHGFKWADKQIPRSWIDE